MGAITATDLTEAKAGLDTTGYHVFENLLSDDEVARFQGAIDALAGERRPGTTTLMGALALDALFVELVQHPVAVELMDHLLGPEFLLSGNTVMIIGPGSKAQPLHNDQAYVPPPWAHPVTANIVWMIDDFTAENGGTLAVPGSHRIDIPNPRGIRTREEWWEEPELSAPLADAITVTGPAGSALVFEGRLWHAGGGNATTDQWRRGVHTYYCRPHLRQQVNWSLSLARDQLEAAPQPLRRLLGLDPYCGVIGLPASARP